MSESVPQSAQITAYIAEARQVVKAGSTLAEALEQGEEYDIADAVRQLNEAASATQLTTRFGFTASGSEGLVPPSELASALIIAQVDASLAQLFVDASHAAGETTSPSPPDKFKRTVESTSTTLEDLQGRSEKLGFDEQARTPISSSNPKQAEVTFKQEAEEAADQVIDESEAQVKKAFSAVAEEKDKIIKAWSQLNVLSEVAAPLADLMRYAWQRLSSALQTLKDIAAWITSDEAVKYLTELIADASLRNCLKKIGGYAAVHDSLENIKFRSSLTTTAIDTKSKDVDALGRHFATIAKRVMAVAAIAAVVAPALTAYFATPLAASFVLPAVYALGIVAIVVTARDYMHEGHFNSRQGILSIIAELAEPKSP
jgi:hypothetical protein